MPDLAALAALFIPALGLENEPELVSHLLALAAQARGQSTADSLQARLDAHPSASLLTEPALSGLPDSSIYEHMPAAMLPILGRHHEVQQICAMLAAASVRLMTFTGPPGVGKTRLALEIAWELALAIPMGCI